MKITTQRLEIHPMCQAEWRDILELFRDFSASPAVIYDFPLPTSEEKAREQVRIWAESGFFYSVCLRGESRVIGYLCFPGEQERDFGYLFHRQWHGKGYAQEAARAMMQELHEKDGICRFTAELRWRTKPRGSWRSDWDLCRWGAASGSSARSRAG